MEQFALNNTEMKKSHVTVKICSDLPELNEELQSTSQPMEPTETIQSSIKVANASLKNSHLPYDEIMKLSAPEKAEVCLQMAMEIIAKQRKVLGNLRLKKWRILKRVNTLKSVVDKLQNNDMNSTEAQDAIKVYKSMSKSYAGWRNNR